MVHAFSGDSPALFTADNANVLLSSEKVTHFSTYTGKAVLVVVEQY